MNSKSWEISQRKTYASNTVGKSKAVPNIFKAYNKWQFTNTFHTLNFWFIKVIDMQYQINFLQINLLQWLLKDGIIGAVFSYAMMLK